MAISFVVSGKTISVTPSVVEIQGMTSANPCVVTWNGHGLSTGDRVSFRDIAQANWMSLNNNSYEVTVINANTFSIPVDSSSWSSYDVGVDPGLVGQDFMLRKLLGDTAVPYIALITYSGLSGDVIRLRDGSPTGAVALAFSDSGGGFIVSVGGRLDVYFKASDCVIYSPPDSVLSFVMK